MGRPTHRPIDPDSEEEFNTYPSRDIEIWRLRSRGVSVREIASRLDISEGVVYARINKAAELFQIEAAEAVIKMELDRLDSLLVKAMDVLEARHVAYSHGKMMEDEDGAPALDPKPVLDAIAAVLKIMDRRSKFLGLDAPTKSEQQINVFKADKADIELKELLTQARANLTGLTPEALSSTPHQTTQTPQVLDLSPDACWDANNTNTNMTHDRLAT